MKMSEQTRESLNRFVQELFNGNARIDNLYYNLTYKNQARLADSIHEPVAHVLGEWADEVTRLMDRLGARAVRYGLEDHNKEYGVKEVFADLSQYFEHLGIVAGKIIEDADMSGDIEVRIFMEDFLNRRILPFRKQAEEWRQASEVLDENTFNIHVDDYTHYLK